MTRARPTPRASCCSPAGSFPYRGSWLDFEFDAKDIVFSRIDRRRKLPVTTLLYALGMDQEGIMDAYYQTVMFKHVKNKGWVTRFFRNACAARVPAMTSSMPTPAR